MEGFLPDWLQLTLLIGTCVLTVLSIVVKVRH